MTENPLASPETLSALLIVVTIFHAFGVILTSFRLWFRYRTRRLWWDDLWAALTVPCNFAGLVGLWLSFAPLDDPYTNFEALPTPAQSRHVHIIVAWLGAIAYTCSIWFARVSIAFSVVRIIPPGVNNGIAAIFSAALFFCLWAYMLISKAIVCAANNGWHSGPVFACALPEWVAISEVCTDVLSDIILVVLPLRLLWRVKLPSNQRILVLSIFSTSILVSIVSAVHTAYIIYAVTFIGPLTAQLGSAVSLIVCNLLVVVSFIYRITHNSRDPSANPAGKQRGALSSYKLTTVDLNTTWVSETGTETRMTTTAITGTNVSSVGFAHPGDSRATLGSA